MKLPDAHRKRTVALGKTLAFTLVAVCLGTTGTVCKKTATCRPGTLLVDLKCGSAGLPDGIDSAELVLTENGFSAPAQLVTLSCPDTHYQVSITGYAPGRMLGGTVTLKSGNQAVRTIALDQMPPLAATCTTWTVTLSPDVDAAADGTIDATIDRASPDTGGDRMVVIDAAPDSLAPDAPDAPDAPVADAPIVDGTPLPPGPDGGTVGNGAPCQLDGQCASGICASSVCCEQACTGKCQSCAPGTGKCDSLPAGTMSNRCATTPVASTCGETGKCDDRGGCALFDTATKCKSASCDTTSLAAIADSFCDGKGTCVTPAASDCGAYKCSAGACGQTCAATADCDGVACVAGSCGGKLGVGAACNANSDCDKGFCVDNVCCENACLGTCTACALTLTGRSDGTCAPAKIGTDPHASCDPGVGCGNDGNCDGLGACRKKGAETTCSAAVCDGLKTFTNPAVCDGMGLCPNPTTSDCGLYRCSSAGCGHAPCATDADCVATAAYCDPTAMQCTSKKAVGVLCGRNQECDRGFCVEGICCDGACGTTCHSCRSTKTMNTDGLCLAVGNGMSCGTNLVCNAGICAMCADGVDCPPAGNLCKMGKTSCASGASMCVDMGNKANGTMCDTAGTMFCNNGSCGACIPGVDCSPGSNMCRIGKTTCMTGTSTCVDMGPQQDGTTCPTGYCAAGLCTPKKAPGATCVNTFECAAGTCVKGAATTTGICCGPTTVVCGGLCVNTASDPNNCGACGKPCAATCTNGACLGCPIVQNAGNLIPNAGFNQNLTPWLLNSGASTTLSWQSVDGGGCAPSSGSMLIADGEPANNTVLVVLSCVNGVTAGQTYDGGLRTFVPTVVDPNTGAAVRGQVVLKVFWFAGPGCLGNPIGSFFPTGPAFPNDMWQATGSSAVAPALTQSAQIQIGVTKFGAIGATSPPMMIGVDMIYLSPSPATF